MMRLCIYLIHGIYITSVYVICICSCCGFIVSCPNLTQPNNGVINCSLGDDGVPSYEDTCSFTCNTGYELTGTENRFCQNDSNWNGNETLCIRGIYNNCVYMYVCTYVCMMYVCMYPVCI